MLERIKNEPALLVGVVGAIIVLAVTFGVPIDESQRTAIVGVVGAVVAILGGGTIRTQVTPARVIQPAEDDSFDISDLPPEDYEEEPVTDTQE